MHGQQNIEIWKISFIFYYHTSVELRLYLCLVGMWNSTQYLHSYLCSWCCEKKKCSSSASYIV